MDPRILLNFEIPQATPVEELRARQMQLRDMRRRERIADMELAEREKGLERMTQIRSLYRMGLKPDELVREAMSVDPQTGMGIASAMREQEKANEDLRKVRLDNRQKEYEYTAGQKAAAASEAYALLQAPEADWPQLWATRVTPALKALEVPDSELADIPNRQQLLTIALRYLPADKQRELLDKIGAEDRAKEKASTDLIDRTWQAIGASRGQADLDSILTGVPEPLRNRFPAMWNPGVVEHANRTAMNSAQRVTADQNQREAEALAQWRKEQGDRSDRHHQDRIATDVYGHNMAARSNDALLPVIMANPEIFERLNPQTQAVLAPRLAEAGFTSFGKPMAEGAITTLADAGSAISLLRELDGFIDKNKGLIGPITGNMALLPYADQAKAIQAQFDLQRQRIGKALEGGVLRKEDEEKYKRILPVITDTPGAARAKVKQLIDVLSSYKDQFEAEQRRAGRRVEKVMTMADVRATATSSGRTEQQVIDAAKAKGYVVR